MCENPGRLQVHVHEALPRHKSGKDMGIDPKLVCFWQRPRSWRIPASGKSLLSG